MSTFYYAKNTNGDYLFDNFPLELQHLAINFQETFKPFLIKISGKEQLARIGQKANSFGIIYVLTTDEKFINRPKLFKELVDVSLISLEPLAKFQESIVKNQISQTQEFIHNLTSLNTYSIQDLFALIPQSVLGQTTNKQNEIVRSVIDEKPNVAVKTLLKMLKHSLATKVEFSVFEKTLKSQSYIKKIDSPVRGAILSILQIFQDDFETLRIIPFLASCDKLISVDNDSLLVSLYYIFDNAVKYCCPGTTFKINFKEESHGFSIIFDMISLRIEKNEVNKLCDHGYRSDMAKKINKDGHGIGMYRIQKTLKINGAELHITPRSNEIKRDNGTIKYEGNEFKITFLGQQDWFKSV